MKSELRSHSVAVIWYNTKEQRHREDGPAVEWNSGAIEYWLEDCQYSFEDWQRRIKLLEFK